MAMTMAAAGITDASWLFRKGKQMRTGWHWDQGPSQDGWLSTLALQCHESFSRGGFGPLAGASCRTVLSAAVGTSPPYFVQLLRALLHFCSCPVYTANEMFQSNHSVANWNPQARDNPSTRSSCGPAMTDHDHDHEGCVGNTLLTLLPVAFTLQPTKALNRGLFLAPALPAAAV